MSNEIDNIIDTWPIVTIKTSTIRRDVINLIQNMVEAPGLNIYEKSYLLQNLTDFTTKHIIL